MHTTLLIRAGWVSICLLTIATASFSQPAPSTAPSATPQQIVYTGSLFGYFRVPDLQSGAQQPGVSLQPCPVASKGGDSKAASAFLKKQSEEFKNAILVGTGDNFAPRLEARMFAPAPADPDRKPDGYPPRNKELYFADGDKWIFYKHINDKDKKDLRDRLAAGLGTIPTDNVGCFLAAAGYAAVVPGKHDFYFGPERVRELARFMASIKQEGYQPVQMLGANLVIKTVRVEDAQSSPGKKKPEWREYLSVLNPREGKSVYPWFSSLVRVKVTAPDGVDIQEEFKRWSQGQPKPELEKFLDYIGELTKADQETGNVTTADQKKWGKFPQAVKALKSVNVCTANDSNEITIETCNPKWQLTEESISLADNAVSYSMFVPRDPAIPLGKDGHYSTFEPGKNYGLCSLTQASTTDDDIGKVCIARFSVYTPFFPFPRQVASIGNNYYDPDPFVFVPKDGNRPYDVAIFGVVDRTIGEQVGVLNFAWLNQDDKLKTVVSAEDPVEALQQQLEYFDRTHKGFTGLKILLAQMSPPLARVLSAHFRDFQVVVTAANQEQGTSETVMSTVWLPSTGARAGAFIAVPSPYFDLKQDKSLEGTLHFGLIEASPDGTSWKLGLTAEKNVPALPVPNDPRMKQEDEDALKKQKDAFQNFVDGGTSRCLSAKSDPLFDRVKWLTLCVMREQTGADVALIQKRDFYNEFRAIGQYDPKDPTWAQTRAQELLDRIVWKGDLLTLLYVPGGAIKKVLDQSTKFDNEDANALSLADEGQRGLEYLGVRKTEKEYLVNEVPIEDKKIYAVATTDYIAAGDTGYPDLAAALNQRRRPTQFPEQLKTISGIVCGALNPTNRFEHCLDELTRDDYLDASVAEVKAPSQPSFGSRLWKLFPFKMPSKDSPPKPTSALEQKAQHHPIWSLALRNLSLGFLSLSNNLTDAQLGAKFAAVSTSGVTAKKTHTVTVGLDTRLSRSSHLNEFFVAMGIDYSEQSTGDVAPSLSRLKNRVTGDASYMRNIRGGRSKDRVGIVFALHAETPLQQPFATFTLGTKDTLKITQNRSVLLLPRLGMRWQNGDNFFEVGGQAGREIQAFSGYRFNTQGSIVECLPSATQTFAACITEKSTAPMTAITKNSVATAILRNRPRAGLYWKYGLSIPFGPKVKYDINQEGNQEADFFFNFHQDNSADTRFLDRSKHSLKFTIWPSFSIGPSLQFLLYRNKVNHDFLFQQQFGFEANFSFNISNHREKEVQIKYKP